MSTTDPAAFAWLTQVSKHFVEGDRQRPVLVDCDLAIETGQFVAIRGRSGSGKSTLLHLLAGLDLPSAGDVYVASACVNRLDAQARTLHRLAHMGFVFQAFNLIPTLTALENVLLPAELARLPSRERTERARALLEAVGLSERAASFPDRLSGGEQQRVAIARALVTEPALVLADEPTGNLDDDTGIVVLELLERLTRAVGRTLVLVTHSREVAARADRVLDLDHGRLIEARRE